MNNPLPFFWRISRKILVIIPIFVLGVLAWDADVRLTTSGYYAAEPGIAARDAKVAVVWEDYRYGNDEIFLKVSSDNGQTWGDDIQISYNDSSSLLPEVAISQNGDIHIVWEDLLAGKMSVFYLRYSASGSMSAATRINATTAYAGYPSVCTHQNKVYIVWEDYRHGNDEIYFRKYDPTFGWSPEIRVSNNDSTSWGADIAADSSGNLYIVWFDYRFGNDEIMVSRSDNDGINWSSPANLSNDTKNSWDPHIAVGTGNSVHVVWYSYLDAQRAYEVSHSSNVGGIWSSRRFLSTLGHDSKLPDVTTVQGNVFIAWEDFRDANDEIYAIRSKDDGSTWGQELRLTNDLSDSYGASIAAAGDYVYSAWFDYRDSVDQIYFKRSTLSQADQVGVRPIAQLAGDRRTPVISLSGSQLIVELAPESPLSSSVRLFDLRGRSLFAKSCYHSRRIAIPTHSLAPGPIFLLLPDANTRRLIHLR